MVSTALVASTRAHRRPVRVALCSRLTRRRGSTSALPLVAPRSVRVALWPESWRDLVPRGAGLPGLCLGMAAYGYGTRTALLVLYLAGQRIGAQSVALTVFAVAFLAVRAAGSPLIDSRGGTAVARVVLGFAIAGLALLAAVPAAPAAVLGTALVGVGVG